MTLWERFAENGLRVLDEEDPGWEYRPNFDLDRLDQRSPRWCMLAQLYGDYHAGKARLGMVGEYSNALATSCGFYRQYSLGSLEQRMYEEYDLLTAAFKMLIGKRLAQIR